MFLAPILNYSLKEPGRISRRKMIAKACSTVSHSSHREKNCPMSKRTLTKTYPVQNHSFTHSAGYYFELLVKHKDRFGVSVSNFQSLYAKPTYVAWHPGLSYLHKTPTSLCECLVCDLQQLVHSEKERIKMSPSQDINEKIKQSSSVWTWGENGQQQQWQGRSGDSRSTAS